MINKELLNYIRVQLRDGVSRDDISATLKTHGGWDHTDILTAFDIVDRAEENVRTHVDDSISPSQSKHFSAKPETIHPATAEHYTETEHHDEIKSANQKKQPLAVSNKFVTHSSSVQNAGHVQKNAVSDSLNSELRIIPDNSKSSFAAQKKKKFFSRAMGISLLGVFAVLILGGAAYAYVFYVYPRTKAAGNPYRIISIAYSNLQKASSYKSNGVSDFELSLVSSPSDVIIDEEGTLSPEKESSNDSLSQIHIGINTNEAYEREDVDDVRREVAIDADVLMRTPTIDVQFNSEQNIKMINNDLYFQLASVPITNIVPKVVFLPIVGKWFTVPTGTTTALMEKDTPLIASLDAIDLEKQKDEYKSEFRKRAVEILPELREITDRSLIDKSDESPELNEYVYEIHATREDWKTIILKIWNISMDTALAVNKKHTSDLMDSIELQHQKEILETKLKNFSEMETLYDILSKMIITIEIGKDDTMIHKVSIKAADSNFSFSPTQSIDFTFSAERTYSEYNIPIKIDRPEVSHSISPDDADVSGFLTSLMLMGFQSSALNNQQ